MNLTFGPETLAMWKVDENKATRIPSHTPGARGGRRGKGRKGERKEERKKTRPKTNKKNHTHRVNLSNSPQNPHPPPTAPTTIPSPIDRIPVLTPQGVIIQTKKLQALDQTVILPSLQLDWSSRKQWEDKKGKRQGVHIKQQKAQNHLRNLHVHKRSDCLVFANLIYVKINLTYLQ